MPSQYIRVWIYVCPTNTCLSRDIRTVQVNTMLSCASTRMHDEKIAYDSTNPHSIHSIKHVLVLVYVCSYIPGTFSYDKL